MVSLAGGDKSVDPKIKVSSGGFCGWIPKYGINQEYK